MGKPVAATRPIGTSWFREATGRTKIGPTTRAPLDAGLCYLAAPGTVGTAASLDLTGLELPLADRFLASNATYLPPLPSARELAGPGPSLRPAVLLVRASLRHPLLTAGTNLSPG